MGGLRIWAKIGLGALVSLGALSGVLRAHTALFPDPPVAGERLQPYELEQLDWMADVVGIEHGSPEYMRAKRDVEDFSGTYADHRLATVAHTLPGALILLLAPIQFIKSVRDRYPRYHRWQGRFLLIMILLSVVPAFYFGLFAPFGGVLESIAIVGFGVLFAASAGRAFLAIRRGHSGLHREWMIRMFSLAIAIAVVRLVNLALIAFIPLVRETFIASIWLGFGSSLAVGEYWIRKTRRNNRSAHLGHRSAAAVPKAFAGGAS